MEGDGATACWIAFVKIHGIERLLTGSVFRDYIVTPAVAEMDPTTLGNYVLAKRP